MKNIPIIEIAIEVRRVIYRILYNAIETVKSLRELGYELEI